MSEEAKQLCNTQIKTTIKHDKKHITLHRKK